MENMPHGKILFSIEKQSRFAMCSKKYFWGCFQSVARFFSEGGGVRGVCGFQDGIVQTVMQAIKRERVSVHETKMGFGFP